MARFIGITGHHDGAAMTEALASRLRHCFNGLNAAQSANPIAAPQNGGDPVLRAIDIAPGSAKEHGHSLHESDGPRHACRKRGWPRLALELLQFNLSQPVASVVIGCEQMAASEKTCRRL